MVPKLDALEPNGTFTGTDNLPVGKSSLERVPISPSKSGFTMLKCSEVDLRLLRRGEAVQQGSQNLFLADRQEKFKAGFRKFLQIRQIELRCNRGLTWDDFSDLYQT